MVMQIFSVWNMNKNTIFIELRFKKNRIHYNLFKFLLLVLLFFYDLLFAILGFARFLHK